MGPTWRSEKTKTVTISISLKWWKNLTELPYYFCFLTETINNNGSNTDFKFQGYNQIGHVYCTLVYKNGAFVLVHKLLGSTTGYHLRICFSAKTELRFCSCGLLQPTMENNVMIQAVNNNRCWTLSPDIMYPYTTANTQQVAKKCQ